MNLARSRHALAVLLTTLLAVGMLGVLAPSAQATDGPTAATAPTAATTPTAPAHLVIAAVWGANGDTAQWTNDWVELYNPTDQDIVLGTNDGSKVTPNYYSCYRGVSASSCSTTVGLYGTVKAHHYFLVWYPSKNTAGVTYGYPAGLTPDLDVSKKTASNGNQVGTDMGGCNTGGQLLLLNSTAKGAGSLVGDLSSADAKAAGVVDAVGWTNANTTQPSGAESNGATPVTGVSSGTTNGCVIARTFDGGVPVDTDTNRTDFTTVAPAAFTVHSQISDHVAVAAVPDTEVSRGEAMSTLQVQGSKGTGALTYAATGLPAGVSIDPSTGAITGTPAAADELKGYPVTVTVTDSSPTGAETATTTFTLTVSSKLRVDDVAAVSVRKGAALDPVQITAHGGTPDYHYAATGLPAGVTIDPATGTVSGTPTGAAGRYPVHVTVTDSGATAQSASVDFAINERPGTTGPATGDPLAGLRINEVEATGTPADDWVELVNTGAAVTGAQVRLVDADGASYAVPQQDVAAGAHLVVEGSALAAAGVHLAATDTLDLLEADDSVLDETSWTAYPATSWARYPDGTGDFAVSKAATKGTTNAVPATYATDHLVIAAVFGANADAIRWTNDWVELYNPTDSPIDLGTVNAAAGTVSSHYTLCYRSYSVTGACSSSVQLSGTVAPHHYFFVWYQNARTPKDHGTYPTGSTPDLDVSVATPANGNQVGSNMGGCNTGGQIQLFDASKGTGPVNGDLSSAAAKAAGVVDAVGWMNASTNQPVAAESKGAATVTGVDSGTNNTCVIARTFRDGYAVDSDVNSADFAPVADIDSFPAHSQHDDRVAITPVADADISLNEPIDPIHVQATAIYGALGFSATGLPAGLSIDPATGVVSGTPTGAAGVYAVTVSVSDATPSDTATTTFQLSLSGTLRMPAVADASVHRGTAITPISAAAHGGTAPYAYTASGLPAGVTIDPATGTISGTPTAALGRYAVHVTATDSAAASGSRDFALVELPATAGPAAGDPLAGLRINEVEATGTPADDWVELYDTGAATPSAALTLEDADGHTYAVPAQAVAAHGYAVVEGAALHAAGLDLDADDTLYLTEADGTLLDSTSWTAYSPSSWARTTDGTGAFATSAYPTKGAANPGEPVIHPNDLLVSEVNYDNNSTDYYEYSEITNTTDHPIDFAAYGLTLTKSGAVMTFHDPADTSQTSPVIDPVIPAHGTQVVWWVENQYFGVKTTAQFLSNYGLPASTPVVLAYGFTSMANSGGDHSYYISVQDGSTTVSRAWVDTPCAANTLNGASACTATNGNYAEHYAVPADRSSADAAVWYNSLYAGGDDINHTLGAKLSTPTTVDLEQLGYTRAVKIASVDSTAITLHNSGSTAVDLSGYVLQKDADGATYPLPAGTTVAAGADLTVAGGTSGLTFADRDYVTLLAPRGYAFSDGLGIADTTGPLLKTLPYDASSGEDPVIDPTTGLPLPPAGGLYRPAGISARDGKLYVSNTGDNLLATIANGTNTIVAGSLEGFGDVGDEGPATDALLYQPGGVAEDAEGTVYVADSGDNVVRKITTDGTIHRFVGTGTAGGDGAAVTATSTPLTVNLWHPNDVVVDGEGNVFIADTNDNRVLEVSAAGRITVVAGTGKAGYSGDGTAATGARLSQPAGIAVDAEDNVYVADSANNVVRRVDAATGVITTVAGDYATGVATSCRGGYGGDGGPATSARLNDPQGVALDGAGDLFIADTFNHAIRMVEPDGTISTLVNTAAVAGAGNASPVGNGAVPATTKLNTPYAVAVDPVSDLVYIADTKNNAIDEVLNAARGGSVAGPVEPADQVAVTGSGVAATTCAVLAGLMTSTTAPSVTGDRTVGSTLTADPGQWTPVADSYSYQWLRDGVAVPGATAATYVVTAADAGHVVAVAVTAVKAEFASASATSAAVPIAVPSASGLTTATPAMTGSVRVGAPVSATTGGWRAGSAAVTTFGYQWLRDGGAIAGATAATYTPTPADRGHTLSVTVTGSYLGYTPASTTSATHVVRAGFLDSTRPRVLGRAVVGHRLTAKAGAWEAGGSRLTGRHLHYQWYADGQWIPGATGAHYTVARADRGAHLTVAVTGSSRGYAATTRWSTHTHAVTTR